MLRILPVFLCTFLFVSAAATRAPAQTVESRLEACRRHTADVLAALREDDLKRALDSLGQAADLSRGIDPNQDDGTPASAGAIYRVLMQRSTDEQYDLLYEWSMPTDRRRSVRILSTLTPHDAPPREFARLLGERPRSTSFPVPEIGGVPGLFSTGWMLVQAADDVGRLSRLTTELEELSEQNVPHSDVLLLLARIADNRSDAAALTEALSSGAVRDSGAGMSPTNPSGIVLATAALTREELRPVSEEILASLEDSAEGPYIVRILPFLRMAHATAVQLHLGESGPEVLHTQRLKYWVAGSGMTADLSSQGAVDAMWLVHEAHILHLAGPRNDLLFFRYPLTGEFDFTCETQEGGIIGTDGGLVYGGLRFEALGSTQQLTVWDADLSHFFRRHCPFVRHEDRPTFNRVTIRSTDDGSTFAANLHPMWFDHSASKTSPWLGLSSSDIKRPLFRNFKLTGEPVIPREVRMSDGDELRGWQANFFGETQPNFTAVPSESVLIQSPELPLDNADWRIEDGVIQGRRLEPQPGATTQSLLRYQRPLLDGETITYEFFHRPGEFDVHPALGRLVFLIEPDGVRIHWITDGAREWTCLPEDNATLEPLNRRGPRPLPLVEGDWNRATLQLAGGKVTLSLNDAVIYERPLDEGADTTFGLYHDRTQSAVQVRNVVMTGDWPDSLPEDFLENPAVVGADAVSVGIGDSQHGQTVDDANRSGSGNSFTTSSRDT